MEVSLSEYPDLIPFLPFALIVRLPLPQRTTCEPSLHLITAFSASVFELFSVSLLSAVSLKVFSVESATSIVTSLDLPQTIGAVLLFDKLSPDKIILTFSVPFLP